MKLFNTLSRQIEDFVPVESVQKNDFSEAHKLVIPESKQRVGLYACGPTVYDFSHIGHLRKYVMDDVLVRVLRHSGYEVKYVRNITDVGHLTSDGDTGEDKLEKGSKKYGQSVWDIAQKFTDHFHYSMDTMGNFMPDVTARVTDHIPEQIALVKRLEERGYTYEIPGDGIYFDTSKFPEYGKMAKLDLEQQKEGARVDTVEGKRNSADFALWKYEREGEQRQMAWESPWAERSFPGWHIECSALSIKYLGEQFDIHTGGIDHIPVHHTNEIAQAEAATGKSPFVKYWVHHNFLQVENEKMSKSLGNFYTIDDVLERGFDPMALRLLYLTSHYRSEQNFTWESLAGMQKAWERLRRQVIDLRMQSQDESEHLRKVLSVQAQKIKKDFFEYMENDLKTPEAVALLWEVLKKSDWSAAEKYALMSEFDGVLGLGLVTLKESVASIEEMSLTLETLPTEVQKLVSEREKARKEKNWKQADALRAQIFQAGYELSDDAQGLRIAKRTEKGGR